MGVILDVNWVFYDTQRQSKAVGWPYEAPFAYQRIAAQATEFASVGFTAINFPPSCECGGGTLSDGYDKKDDYSFDNTAFGTREMLQQAVAVIHANGMEVYGDLVLHQYGGDGSGTYPTKRFPKFPTCFSIDSTKGGVPSDPVPDTAGNFSFGDMACYYTSTPGGYMYFGAIAAAEFQTQSIDFDGYRIDDVKGTYVGVVKGILESGINTNLFAFGEYFDGNPQAVSWWVNNDMGRRAAVLDFAFKFNVGNICNNNSRVWMGQLSNIGWCNDDPYTAITFVESADTDTSPGEQVAFNKMLGYAIMLTFPGYPRVYYRDWSTDENCYGLKKEINNLIWIHENLAQGEHVVRLGNDPQVFAHERLGYGDAPGCVCFFNNDQYTSHTKTVQTNFGSNQRLHEYTGNGNYYNDVWTNENGQLTVTVPPNDNGMSYLVFSLPEVQGKSFELAPRLTTQTIFGGHDLNIPAAINGTIVINPRLWVEEGFLDVTLSAVTKGWGNAAELVLTVISPMGAKVQTIAFDDQATTQSPVSVPIHTDGWHTLTLTGSGLPETGTAWSIKATYEATQGI